MNDTTCEHLLGYRTEHGARVCQTCAVPWADVERAEELRALRIAIEYAPRAVPVGAADLAGWRTPAGLFVCRYCAGRIMARGCTLPRNSFSVWKDQPGALADCALAATHQ